MHTFSENCILGVCWVPNSLHQILIDCVELLFFEPPIVLAIEDFFVNVLLVIQVFANVTVEK